MNFCSCCRKEKTNEDFEIVDGTMRKTCLQCKDKRKKNNQRTYEKCLVYSIECLTTNDLYIGSTKHKINKRLDGHKYSGNGCLSKSIIKRGNYKVNILEEVSCNSKKELLIKEREYIEKINCINKYVPINLFEGESQKRYRETHKELVKEKSRIYDSNRDKKKRDEKNKRYYERNKEKCNEYKRQWYIENRERILAERKQKSKA